MDNALGNVNEVARAGLDHVSAIWPGLHPQGAFHYKYGSVMVTVVMPARGHVSFGSNETGPHAFDSDRLLADHARRRVTFVAFLRGDQHNPVIASHKFYLDSHPCRSRPRRVWSGIPEAARVFAHRRYAEGFRGV